MEMRSSTKLPASRNLGTLMMPIIGMLALIVPPLAAAQNGAVIREQRTVTIGGVKEVWRLIWRNTPTDSQGCGPADPDMAMTCPCSGVAYAQVGDLVLERKRPNAPVDRMSLSPLFANSELLIGEQSAVAMLATWPARLSDIDRSPTPATIRARPVVPILRLRDYDHDGVASEFLLQIDTAPCGKHVMVAVGVTRDDQRLHALSSVGHPGQPLMLFKWQWDALARKSSPGEVMDWPCGDHGADEETTMVLRADHGRIHATRVTSTCPDTVDAKGGWHRDPHFRKKTLKRELI